tara:strand:+ start:2011 stop:2739 length:729 start_codon:yes stop_codon:yes gene_type:complete
MKPTHTDFLKTAAAALAFVALPVLNAVAGDDSKLVIEAQELYEDAVADGIATPYIAPLSSDPEGPQYLWGGLDPIEVIKVHESKIADDPGQTLFISRSGSTLGSPDFPLQVPIYDGGPSETALFKSAENRTQYEQMMAEGTLLVTFGLNCHWGIISGPATNFTGHSHWAQPGLAAIVVDTIKVKNPDTKKNVNVTVVGANLYSRGDDWNATKKRWQYAVEAFLLLDEHWERKRVGMPILQVN